MNGPFKIGEVLIFKGLPANPWVQNGEECTVIGPLALRTYYDQIDKLCEGWCYLVSTADIDELVVDERNLTRRPPPMSFTGEERIRELFTVSPVKEMEPA